MLKAIQKYLTSDVELVNLVGYTPKNQRIHPYIPKDRTDYPYIVFGAYPFLAENPLTQYRCEVTILSMDVLQLESITNRLLELLNFKNKPGFMVDDKPFYHSSHVGGSGINYDPNQKLFEQVLIFNIKSN